MQRAKFYYFDNSDFSQTPLGQMSLFVTEFVLNLMSCICVGISLNVFSLLKFKSYLKRKRQEQIEEEMTIMSSSTTHTTRQPTMTQQNLNERQAERTMFYLILILCSISICTRVCSMCCFFLVLFFSTFSHRLTLMLVTYFIFSFLATFALFVFYSFDKKFRHYFHGIFSLSLTWSFWKKIKLL